MLFEATYKEDGISFWLTKRGQAFLMDQPPHSKHTTYSSKTRVSSRRCLGFIKRGLFPGKNIPLDRCGRMHASLSILWPVSAAIPSLD